VAVVDVARGAVLAEASVETPALSAALLPLAEQCLGAAGVTRAELDAIAVGAGPGTFTGLRIGLATAKGLAFALERPLWVASSLAALAWDARSLVAAGTVIAAALDARRGEIYAGLFSAGPSGLAALAGERVLAPGELAAWAADVAPGQPRVLVGDARDVHGDALTAWSATPDGRATDAARGGGGGAGRGDGRSRLAPRRRRAGLRATPRGGADVPGRRAGRAPPQLVAARRRAARVATCSPRRSSSRCASSACGSTPPAGSDPADPERAQLVAAGKRWSLG
jgi:tRNA threonylcarbamoyl adenosine modification protein YeaZ